ncbi:MAG TPA: cation:proton antiporter [Candidatus Obscuribacterales bacterium]
MFSESAILSLLVAIATVLLVGRGTAELARRFHQPEVLGELIGGFLLGNSVFGALLPRLHTSIFETPEVAHSLQALSTIGALLVLLVAGIEADLRILSGKIRPGILTAVFAIISSVAAGIVLGRTMLHTDFVKASFFGVVLSVTAVSVASKILMETNSTRRDYAQVILAAGIASEVVAWLLLSLVASIHNHDGVLSGARVLVFAALFLLFMFTIGKRAVFWMMRRMSDMASVTNGQLTLVLILTSIFAAVTEALGLHALLGAFIFGVVLGESPRFSEKLRGSVIGLTTGLFGPIFFVLAGMRVDILRIATPDAALAVVTIFVVATAVKLAASFIGARVGRLPWKQAALIGCGVNLKGGTDVVVAIIGTQIGLLAPAGYTIYTVVAMLTVLFSPPLIFALQRSVLPDDEERERLNTEEAKRRGYLSTVERVLAPALPELLPSWAADVLKDIAEAKEKEHEVFDITKLNFPETTVVRPHGEIEKAESSLEQANALNNTELSEQESAAEDPIDRIVRSAGDHAIVAIGANPPPTDATMLTLGRMQDQIIDRTNADVLVVIRDSKHPDERVRRILVPIAGSEHSFAAADLAAYIAKGTDAELMIFHVMHMDKSAHTWSRSARRQLMQAGYQVANEAAFRCRRLGVDIRKKVKLGSDPAGDILREVKRGGYDLLVMGAVEKASSGEIFLGGQTQTVLRHVGIPVALLVAKTLNAA